MRLRALRANAVKGAASDVLTWVRAGLIRNSIGLSTHTELQPAFRRVLRPLRGREGREGREDPA